MSHHEFTTTIEFEDEELELEVEFDYQPAEPKTYWHPGCSAEVEITSAKVSSQEIPNWVFNCISYQLANDAYEFLAQIRESYEADRAEYLIEQRRSRYA